MKILMVTRNFTSGEATSGGIENYLYALCGELSKDHEVTVVSASRNPHTPNYSLQISNTNKIKVIKIVRNYISIKSILADPLFFIRDRSIENIFSKLLDLEVPDIVHIHHLNDLSFGIVNAIKSKSIPMIITLHDLRLIHTHTYLYSPKTFKLDPETCEAFFPVFYRKKIEYSLAKRLGGLPARFAAKIILIIKKLKGLTCEKIEQMRIGYAKDTLKQADMLLAPSRFVQDIYSKYADKDNIRIKELGIVPPRITNKHTGNKVRFGYVGGLMVHKGINVLLNAFNNIKTNDAHLYIYGDELKDGSSKMIVSKNSNNKNISFAGMYKDSGDLFSNIDVLIVPSICNETYSLAAHEAFAAHIPVIASNCGAFPEYISNDVNGFLFDPADEKGLHDILNKIINDPDILNKMIRNMPKVLTIKEDAGQLISIYRGLRSRK